MIDFGVFQFAAPPRTGTTWFLQAAASVGLVHGVGNCRFSAAPRSGYSVSLVRHPYDWLVSYYLSPKVKGEKIKALSEVNELIASSNSLYEALVGASKRPGIIGDVFERYPANSVMKIEEFPWCAMEFFESIGASYTTVQPIATIPAQSVRSGVVHIPDPDIRRRIIESERYFCNTYEYF